MKRSTRFKMWPAVMFAMFTILSTLTTPVDAFFRHLCHGQVGQGRIDPIMSPGKTSAHVHNIQGASNFGFDPTIDELMASNCTSCSIRQDKSSYWSPQMYFQHDNGTFEIIPTSGGLTAYYFTETPDTGDQVHPFPKNFRMITGNNSKRAGTLPFPDKDMSLWDANDQEALMERSLGFNCLNYLDTKKIEGSLQVHYMRDKNFIDNNCPDGIRAEIQFPSCWNGKDLDSADHKSHVAYPSRLRNGPCPDGFNTRLITLFFETIYQTDLFKGMGGQFVFANGDPTGYGYHADFIAGWDDGVLEEVINNPACTSGASRGVQEDCPVFNLKAIDDPETINCKMNIPDPIKKEAISLVEKLPGNVPIQSGPEPATMPNMLSAATSSASPAAGSSASPASLTSVAPPPGNTTAAAAYPSTTPAPTVPPANTNEIITKTSVTVIDGTVYHWIILEEIVTTTVVADNVAHAQAKRHGHSHRHYIRQ